jgi:tetratricopeptide (TPR) repeat protein
MKAQSQIHAWKNPVLVLWLLLTAVVSSAQIQQQSNSTYQQSLNTSQNSSRFQGFSRIDVYLDSARYLSDKAPMKAVDYINKAIEQSIGEGDAKREAQAFLILGDIQQHLDQHDLAVENYKKCILALSRKKTGFAKSLTGTGNVYLPNASILFHAYEHMATSLSELKNPEEALEKITVSIGQYGNSVSQKEQLEASRIKANILLGQGKVQLARETLTAVLEKEQTSKNTTGEIETLLAIGKTYEKEGNENTALDYYTKAKDLSEKTKQPELTIQANESMAGIYRAQKQVDKEVEVRNSNIGLNLSTNNGFANYRQNVEIGNAYLNANQTDLAASYYGLTSTTPGTYSVSVKDANGCIVSGSATSFSSFNNTASTNTYMWAPSATTQQLVFANGGTMNYGDQQKLIRVSDNLEETARGYKQLALQYAKQKQYNKSILYFEKYADLQDSIKNVRKKEQDEAIAISTNIGKNAQRIDLLEKERDLNNKSIDILKQDQQLKEEQLGWKNGIILTLSVVVLLMLVGVFFVVRSSREKKKAHQLLALKSLRGQMNPHFIFNALNSVNHYVSQNDERQANRYLSDFSRLMRLVMDSSKYDFIALNDELEMLRLYLQLEHARFSDKFEYEIEVSEEVENAEWELPPMLIQPYLENAVWHGLRYIDGRGTLKLSLEQENGSLAVTITDSGIGRNRSRELKTMNQMKQNSTGMQNISSRVQIMNELFRSQIRVEVSDAFPGEANCGTLVKLIIPKKPNTHA